MAPAIFRDSSEMVEINLLPVQSLNKPFSDGTSHEDFLDHAA
jgi:hypothetical protein